MTIHQMDILDRSGHLHLDWDPDNTQQVRAARETFEEMTGKGYKAFMVGDNGKGQGGQIRRFDPSVEEMILVPPVQGG
jgi:hypothetical protein